MYAAVWILGIVFALVLVFVKVLPLVAALMAGGY